MRIRSKRLNGFVAIAAASVLAIGACSTSNDGGGGKQQSSPGFATCETDPNGCNSGPTKAGGSIVVALEKKVQNWNIGDADGNTFDTVQIMNGLIPTPYVAQPNNSVAWNQDLLVEEPKVTNQTPQTIQYKIRPEAVWDDGTPMTYKDFSYYWKVTNGTDCPDCTPAGTTGYELIKSIEGADNDKTVIVTFKDGETYPDWKGLFNIFPSHLAAQQGDLTTPAGLLKAFEYFKGTPTWSGWAYKFQEYQKDVSVTLVPNPKWYGKSKVALEKITFRIIEDQAQQTPALQNKEVHMLISQPNDDMVKKVQGMAGVNYHLSAGPTWEHLDFNTKNTTLADVELRKAIFTAVNRQDIITKTIGPFFPKGAPLNNHNFMPGAPGYKDTITPTGQGAGSVDAAKKILNDAGYKIEGDKLIGKNGQPVPPLRFRYTNGNQLRQQTGELVQSHLKAIGIELKIEPTPSLGNTLSTGDFDIIIFAWVGTPFAADNRALWHTDGGSNYGKWSNKEADVLLDQAAKELDENKMRELFNQADEIMSKEAYVLPLYQKPVFIAVYGDYIEVRNNPTSAGPTYNMEKWGLKADSVK
jgi:peptide/nickel transport system substrate-binding protein